MNGHYCPDCGIALDLTASYLDGDEVGLLLFLRCPECGGVYAKVTAGDRSVVLRLAESGVWKMAVADDEASETSYRRFTPA